MRFIAKKRHVLKMKQGTKRSKQDYKTETEAISQVKEEKDLSYNTT